MKRYPSACLPHVPHKALQRHTPKGYDHLLSEIREHGERGVELRIWHLRGGFFSIVRNGTLWLARPADGSPIGSFENIAAAVMAGDRHLNAGDDDAFGDDDPRGAA